MTVVVPVPRSDYEGAGRVSLVLIREVIFSIFLWEV
jgi:hypothetical protein